MLRTLFIIPVFCLAACAARPTRLPDDLPADFTLLVTVYPPPNEVSEPWRRPARYAIEPDGVLYAESGAGVTSPGFPPMARRLDPGEAERIYELTKGVAPLGPDATPVTGVGVYTPPEDRQVAVIEVGAADRYLAGQLDIGEARPLVRRLADLSWLNPEFRSNVERPGAP